MTVYLNGELRRPIELISAIGRKARELPLHRVDPGDIGRDEMIAAALARDHPKVTARESRRRSRAAEMDEGGQILFCCGCLHITRARENPCDIAVEIHRRQFDGMARDRADMQAGEPAAGIGDRLSRIQNRAASAEAASRVWNRPTALERAGRSRKD